jgi:hypothetical protein
MALVVGHDAAGALALYCGLALNLNEFLYLDGRMVRGLNQSYRATVLVMLSEVEGSAYWA